MWDLNLQRSNEDRDSRTIKPGFRRRLFGKESCIQCRLTQIESYWKEYCIANTWLSLLVVGQL